MVTDDAGLHSTSLSCLDKFGLENERIAAGTPVEVERTAAIFCTKALFSPVFHPSNTKDKSPCSVQEVSRVISHPVC